MYWNVLLNGSNETGMHLSEKLTKILLSSHSGIRYVLLLLIILAIIYAWQTFKKAAPFSRRTKRMAMFTMIAADIQFLAGALLYFNFIGSQSNFQIGKFGDQLDHSFFRFFAIDHALGMLIAIILIHIGYSKAKKAVSDKLSGKRIFTFYLIALIIILLSIPWPFMELHSSRGWF